MSDQVIPTTHGDVEKGDVFLVRRGRGAVKEIIKIDGGDRSQIQYKIILPYDALPFLVNVADFNREWRVRQIRGVKIDSTEKAKKIAELHDLLEILKKVQDAFSDPVF